MKMKLWIRKYIPNTVTVVSGAPSSVFSSSACAAVSAVLRPGNAYEETVKTPVNTARQRITEIILLAVDMVFSPCFYYICG